MSKKSGNGKSKNWEANYELPRELDFRKLRVVGVGMDALRKHAAARRRMVELEPDVAKGFSTAKEVNDALRLVQQLRQTGSGRKRKKSA